MKRHIISSILIIILIISVTQFHAQSVGINTSSPDGSAALDVVSNSKGILIPRMNSGQRTGIASPADGLLVFDTQTESFWYYQSTGWLELSGGAFTNDGGTVRNTGNHATDDFVFGSDALPPTSAISDTLMFFDKSKGAFRVGKIFSSESWSNNNIGLYSFGAGQNAKAVGNYSISMGLSTTASGSQSVAIGTANTASGHFAFAGGTVNQASGENSTTFGNNVKSSSFLGFSLGHFNVGNFSSANTWILTDPLFEIGNGTSSTNLSNALTVLKNGDFIVGKEITPPSTAITDTMMFFDKSKGAFRSGSIFNSNVWSDVALGKFSFASGLNTRAFGVSSSAFGDGAVAEGQASFAGGVGSIAVELGSFAFGGGTVALENYATAFGNSTKANEASSTALGFFTIANGVNSTSMGQSTRSQARSSTALGMYNVGIGDVSLIIPADPIFEVGIGTSEATRKNALTVTKAGDVLFKNHFAPIQGTNYSGATFYFNNAKTALRMGNLHEAASWSDSIGLYSLGIGNRTVAKGFASIALGNENTALGTGSVALGWKAIARSSASIAFGQYVNSPSKAAISLGSYNVGLGVDDNIWHDNDPILEVGIGQSEATRQNAMTILKNGYVGIGNSAPDALVHIEKSSTLSDPQILINEIGYDYARLTMKNDQYTSFWTLASRPNDTPADSRFNIFNSDGGDILSLQGDGDAIISERLVVGATAPLAALHANSNMGEDALRIQSNGATKMRVYENGSISLAEIMEIRHPQDRQMTYS